MDKKTEQINLILLKIENLMVKQQGFESEIKALKAEVNALRDREEFPLPTDQPQVNTYESPTSSSIRSPFPAPATNPSFADRFKNERISKTDFEKFIGENLISKVGILILIIGVGIGAKLAIDKGLISPLTRIILGYVIGAALLGLAIKLKKNYLNFSAVLLSGAIAILYFITYAAHAYYQLIPQALAFGIMVVFTGFAVTAAIKYNKSIIANIGLVGAYAVPFLLSDGSGKVEILFTYIAIINLGILALAFSKYWKSLFYQSFGLTWIIFLGWHLSMNGSIAHSQLSLIFSFIYFLTFYITNLAYKVVKKENFDVFDVAVLLVNSFIFYGIGYDVLSLTPKGEASLGLFTLANAIFHLVFALVIYKRELADRSLFYFIVALVITFITMAIPVQLNGNWVTIFWSIEAAILFVLAHKKQQPILEKLSFPLVFLAFFSLLHDWTVHIDFFNYTTVEYVENPFFNIGFLTACILIVSLACMFFTNRKVDPIKQTTFGKILTYVLPSMLIIVTYCTFRIEITTIFENLYQNTKLDKSPDNQTSDLAYNKDLPLLSACCSYIFTFLFASTLTILNLRYFKSKIMANATIAINLVIILAFLIHGIFVLSELRESYLLDNAKHTTFKDELYFAHGVINIAIRYVLYLCFAVLIWSCYQLSRTAIFETKFRTVFDYLLYLSILWLLSTELLNILALNGLTNGYKLGISILWGSYAFLLIGLGLWKNKRHLRIGAIALFAITLIKLFLYDISNLDTIAKTIVFVSLGALLLSISFLYNKYKHLVNNNEENGMSH